MNQLECTPAIGSRQFKFEELCAAKFGLNYASMSINITDNRYCNPNINWMWQMFAEHEEN